VLAEFPGLDTQTSQPVTSFGGETFTAFAKATTPLHSVGLYEDVIEPHFRAGMEVQSWLNGRNAMPSQCPPTTQYESLNVRHVYVRVANRGWDNTVDHSKWSVSIPNAHQNSSWGEGQGAVCFGDMNRMEAQLFRGGGAMCFTNNTAVWQTFRALIFAIEGCHDEVKS
jgi:hypothetical protein